MPAVAVVSLIGVAALVAVLAGYLITVAVKLTHVVGRLNVILGAVGAVVDESAPIADVAGRINADLEASRQALEAALPPPPAQSNGRSSTGAGVR